VIDLGPIGIWTASLEAQPAAVAQDAAREIESLGYSALWLNETTGRDPFVLSSLLLSATSTLTVATGIANVYARDAMTTSSCQKTLAEAFPGRFLLGLGVSSPALVEKVRGHDYGKPLTYMREYLEAMDAARYTSVAPSVEPRRVLAALGPKMLELSASHADGAHPYLTTPEHTRDARAAIGDAFLAPEQMVMLETDPDVARGVGRLFISFYLRAPGYLANLRRLGFDDSDWADPRAASDRLVDAIVAWGDLDAVTARVRGHLDAGADHVCIQVLSANPRLPFDEWKRLAGALI
jgi:probable F420-dependent oxidoreductase